ncbi:MAG: Gfo/Idh/MocA family oxidoreductase [Lentisphaeraceae bacterium]|nr:Gfo/Idh/MocA family oxidoreductase [Lentisphaeraceae bacterium]
MADLKKNWGILGAGVIASKLAKGINQTDAAVLYAVGSRDVSKSQDFAREYGAEKAFGSYEELCQCPDIDVIYIATPHSFHKEHTMLALNNGKNVLCEKPFSLNLQDSEEMLSLAKSKGLFLMEAMWTCLLPGMKKLQELLSGGAIGQVLYMEADFGFQEPFDKNARLFNPQLGGGALLDVGIYPLTLATFLFGKPKKVTANARMGQSGVDELSCYNLEFENRVIANLSASIAVETSHSATIYGTEGTIHIPADWWLMEKLIITNGSKREIDTSYEGSEYTFEVQEVCDCLFNGQTESQTLPHDWTRGIMSLMDQIRADIGLVYPGEVLTEV